MYADRALHSSSESQSCENLPRRARTVEIRFGDGEPFSIPSGAPVTWSRPPPNPISKV